MAFDLRSMTVQRMLAQRVMPRLEGELLTDSAYMKEIAALVQAGIGGFILFGGNFWEVRKELAKLQAKAKVPLVIASDMERGAGQQLKGATAFPCQMAVSAGTDLVYGDGLGLVSEMLEGIAAEARGAGVHAVLGPVLDVNSAPQNPIICTRAFSDEPKAVSSLGEMYVNGLQGAPHPVMACAKHYPGHGESTLDSHSVLPVVDKDKESLEAEDMLPFRRAIMAGVEMVMTAHLKVPSLDAAYPASLSKNVIRNYLRLRAGFLGISITDAMNMAAITGQYPPEEAARLAIKAGEDILLHPDDPAEYLGALNELAKSKALTKEDIMAPALRLTRAKQKYCLPAKISDNEMANIISRNEEVAEAIALRALTLVKAAGAFPALKEFKGTIAHIVLEDDGDAKAGRVFRSALAKHKNMKSLFVTQCKLKALKAEALKESKGAALTVVSIFSKVRAGKGRSGIHPDLLDLGRQIVTKNKKSVVVSFGSPYILKDFMDADYVVAAYDPSKRCRRRPTAPSPATSSSWASCLSESADDCRGRIYRLRCAPQHHRIRMVQEAGRTHYRRDSDEGLLPPRVHDIFIRNPRSRDVYNLPPVGHIHLSAAARRRTPLPHHPVFRLRAHGRRVQAVLAGLL